MDKAENAIARPTAPERGAYPNCDQPAHDKQDEHRMQHEHGIGQSSHGVWVRSIFEDA
jgi:hypothetical protein